MSSTVSVSSETRKVNNETIGSLQAMRNKLDSEFINVALPAFIGLAAEPLASLVDAIYVGRCGPVEQAGMGIAISAQYSVAKLYNDPLLKTSTSIVANKSGDDLSASVATAIVTAVIIGILQSLGFVFFGGQFLSLMGVAKTAEMRKPAIRYLVWRALGIPAATVLLVTNGIFRGRGDTKTPLYCTTFGNLINIILDPILIFGCGMGCAGAGAATAVSQWAAAIPLLYLLNKSIPFNLLKQKGFIQQALQSYAAAGSLIMLRTVAKISAYTVTSSAAARLGTIPMAAYSLTFNLGFATSQLCESISIAAQALIARDIPLDSPRKRAATAHVIMRGLQLGILVSAALAMTTIYNQKGVLQGMTASAEVRAAAAAVMPVVLTTQIFKGMSYSTGGILLGGMDWYHSTMGMVAASVACIGLVLVLPLSLRNIWIGLAAFMGMQVVCAGWRLLSGEGPWKGLNLLSIDPNRFLHEKEDDMAPVENNANLQLADSTSNSTSSSSTSDSENPPTPQLA
jgi:putative MATE family efflux protein